MSYSLVYFDEARQDIKEAKEWYKKQSHGLEMRYAASVKSIILYIRQHPYAFAIRHKNIRIAHPKIFPYGIHYYIDESTRSIVIVAIIHNKRNPETTDNRL